MADQGVRYVVTLTDQNVVSGLMNMDRSANKTESSIASLNNTLRETSAALGLGFGIHGLIAFGKDAVQGAADYEAAVKRIRFASENLAEGAKNVAFINSEVDKFKIPLQDATDAYGKFLAMLKGSGIAGEQVRSLHDQLLLIGKIKGLGDGQMDAAVMNLGKMLESGSLDARHFRPLEQQLSGIGQFVANELGISLHDLAVLRNKGKMTTIDPKVLLTAIRKQAESLQGFLPESLTTIQSGLNEVSTAWVRFKNELVFDNRKELVELFDTLKDGVKFLSDHKKDIKETASLIIHIGEAFLIGKTAMAAYNLASNTTTAFMSGYAGNAAIQVSAVESQAIAFNSLAAAMERVAFASEVMAGSSLSGVVGVGKYGIPLASAGVSTAAAGGVGAIEATTVSLLGSAAVITAAAALGVYLLDKYGVKSKGVNMGRGGGYYDTDMDSQLKGHFEKDTVGYNVLPKYANIDDYNRGISSGQDTTFLTKDKFVHDAAASSSFDKMSAEQRANLRRLFPNSNIEDPNSIKKHKSSDRITAPNDRINAPKVVSYHTTINGGITGIKENIVQNGGKMDPDAVALQLRDIIVSIVNDSQIRAGQ